MPTNENIRRINRCRKDGLFIVEPKPNELQLDLDGEQAIHVYCRQFHMLKKEGFTSNWKRKIKASKSGGCRMHVTITLPKPINNVLRVAFQAVLGSDIKREALNLCRVLNKNKYPIIFFERGRTEK